MSRPLIPWPWIVAAVVAITCALALSGCASVADDIALMEETARVNATPSPDYPQLVIRVQDPDAACRAIGAVSYGDNRIQGCADFSGRVAPGFCTIIVPKDAPAWLMAHERLHCKYGRWHR